MKPSFAQPKNISKDQTSNPKFFFFESAYWPSLRNTEVALDGGKKNVTDEQRDGLGIARSRMYKPIAFNSIIPNCHQMVSLGINHHCNFAWPWLSLLLDLSDDHHYLRDDHHLSSPMMIIILVRQWSFGEFLIWTSRQWGCLPSPLIGLHWKS